MKKIKDIIEILEDKFFMSDFMSDLLMFAKKHPDLSRIISSAIGCFIGILLSVLLFGSN